MGRPLESKGLMSLPYLLALDKRLVVRAWTGAETAGLEYTRRVQTQAMEKMLKLAAEYPEYRANAAKVKLVDTTAGEYYGKGYQDVSNRVPKIENTRQELGWEPKVSMRDALKQIFEAYKGQISQASHLLD